MQEFIVRTQQHEEMVDITREVQRELSRFHDGNGAVMLFCPHTTCGLTINEKADPDVRKDLMKFFREIAPRQHGWAHCEGNSDAHIRASLLGASLLLPVEAGILKLGTWQSIYLYEGDGPRTRKLWLQLLPL